MTNASHILFFDIETVSGEKSYIDLSPTMQEHRNHKMKYELTKSENEGLTAQDLYTQKAGIYAEFGKIVCISVGYMVKDSDTGTTTMRVKSFTGDDEKKLLEDFFELLKGHYNKQIHRLCGHNIKEFDVPYICRRGLLHGLKLPYILQVQGKKPWETQYIDTMEMRKFGDRKQYTKLSLMCEIFDIPTPKDDITGADVTTVYRGEEGGLERIQTYCEKDVIATSKLWEKLSRI